MQPTIDQVIHHGLSLVRLWASVHDPRDPWYMHDARQAYRDALASMKASYLIADFDLESITLRDGTRVFAKK